MIDALPLLLGPEGYQISRSVRLRNSATGYFSRTITGTATNAKIGTLSMWVKRGALSAATGNDQYLIQTGISATTNNGHFTMFFATSDTLAFGQYSWAGYVTTQVFRDPSAWYHVVLSYNSTLASNNLTIYVNGVQIGITSVPQNTNWAILSGTEAINIGRHTSVGRSFDGYLTEINLIDGQALTPLSFGETNPVTGVWQPKKYTGTYGTNGFYLNFSDNSAATAAAIGKDSSGNGNNWTPNNISVTAGATYDSMLDVPTMWADGGNGRGNYCTLNPITASNSNVTISNGNLRVQLGTASQNRTLIASIPASSGKWYFEGTVTATGGGGDVMIGILNPTNVFQGNAYIGQFSTGYCYAGNAIRYNNGSGVSYGATYTTNDVIGVALDLSVGTLTFYKNGVSQGTAYSGISGEFCFALTGGSSAPTWDANFGQRPFAYTPPTGFKALNTLNLPEPTIPNGRKFFDSLLWTSTATVKDITGSDFQPDLVWVKSRSSANANEGYHHLVDAVRGAGKVLSSNVTDAEYWTGTNNSVQAFLPNGFTAGDADGLNGNAMVSWLWKEGSTQGFDIVTYTGTGANQNISHSLGVAPKMIITKSRNAAYFWGVYHQSLGAGGGLYLNTTDAYAASTTLWGNTTPTSSVFTVGNNGNTGLSATNYVAYLFSEVAGFSKFGSYTGNGSADGVFVHLGFLPRFVMVKNITTGATSWCTFDGARETANVVDLVLYPNTSDAEQSFTAALDFLSNGFKLRATDNRLNASSNTYIFAAFAANPFRNALAF